MPHTIKNKTLSQRGNAMIYVLIALALFGFLTMTLSRSNDQADGQDIDDEQAALYATELIEYAASAQNAVNMMIASGSEIDGLSFIDPSDAGFNTTPPPNYNKVFHPQGGGLNFITQMSSGIQTDATSQWVLKRNNNIEWTPLDAGGGIIDDVILTAYLINRQICERINLKITGNSIIPVTSSPHADYFLESGTDDLTIAECAGCEGYPTLCVENDTNDGYSFYTLIAAQ